MIERLEINEILGNDLLRISFLIYLLMTGLLSFFLATTALILKKKPYKKEIIKIGNNNTKIYVTTKNPSSISIVYPPLF